MTFNTIILLLLAIAFAGGLSFFQYFYKSKVRSKTYFGLAFLRFLSIFGILLLLINPIISRKTFEILKTPLPIVFDNSSSIRDLKATYVSNQLFEKLNDNSDLKNKFEIQNYAVDSEFKNVESQDSITYNGKQSQFDLISKNLKSNYKNQSYPTIFISDGNQTKGADFVFSFDIDNKIFPIIVGDTTKYLDLRIGQINANQYAFHKNKFPVEVFLNYSGSQTISANFEISQGTTILNKQSISFSKSKKSEIVNLLLPANKIGIQQFTVKITSNQVEKNTYNNYKKFVVEVLELKSEIAMISSINHPDLGALKRSIETNAQRKVTIFKPNEIKEISKYSTLILYQPNTDFKAIFETIKNSKVGALIITGTSTDYNFLNQQQEQVNFKMSSQKEDFLCRFEPNFNLYAQENIGFEKFPPLENLYGTITLTQNATVLLSSQIRNVSTNQPLLAFSENQGARTAYLFGENSWKWRSQSFMDAKSFDKFDIFIDKIIQFLSTNNSKKSLVVKHQRFYNSGDAIEIEAEYFNKNYELDQNARLTISVTNTKNKQTKKYDFLKSNTSFKVNLDGLDAGTYNFSVKELNSNSTYSSNFEILDFEIEKQFVHADVEKMNQLAQQTNGAAFVPNQIEKLIEILSNDENYKPIQKEVIKKTPLIDWVWLLVLISICLALEWFIRKYNGML